MPTVIARNWWSMLIRGIAAVVFGILALSWPGKTFALLVVLFGAFALVHGIAAIAGAVRKSRGQERWGGLLLEGIVGVAAGIIAFAWPAITGLALVLLISAWALITGITEITAAIRLRRYIRGEWRLVLSGVISIILAAFLFASPAAGAVAIALAVGIYAIIFGVLEIALAFRLRTWEGLLPEAERLRPAA
ncbi:MAG: HdeD family acid-resistance protein [Rhodospirillales bacterium]